MKTKIKMKPIDCWGLTGSELRQARERSGVSIRELAEEWGINVGDLSNVEQGKRISRPLVERYMKRFGIAGAGKITDVPRGTYIWVEAAA